MAGYRIVVHRQAVREIDDVEPRALRQRVHDTIAQLGAVPRPPGVEPLSGYKGYFRVRVGDYRIVYTIDDASATVQVRLIGHRRDVYERLRRL